MTTIPLSEYEGPDHVLTPHDYSMALASQSACNLSGIVHSFSEMMHRVFDEAKARKKGTDWVNQHPICRLFAEQIVFLSSRDYLASSNYCDARKEK